MDQMCEIFQEMIFGRKGMKSKKYSEMTCNNIRNISQRDKRKANL